MPARRGPSALVRPALLSSAILFAGLALTTLDAAAETAPPRETAPDTGWERALGKAFSYELLANLTDVAIMIALTGGVSAVGPTFIATNLLTAVAANYAHEAVWTLGDPPADDAEELTVTAEKAITYRLVNLTRSTALGYVFSGDAAVALAFALTGSLVDSVIYVANEVAWNTYAPLPHGPRAVAITPPPVRPGAPGAGG